MGGLQLSKSFMPVIFVAGEQVAVKYEAHSSQGVDV